MALSISTTQDGDSLLVQVAGEVDVSNANELRDAVQLALDGDAANVVVNLAQVPYIDSTGIGVLVGAVRRAKDKGSSLVVVEPQRNVARVLSLLGVSAELGVDGA